MLIKKIVIFECKISLGFKYSTWTNNESRSILIKIETDEGLIGWGEYVVNRWNTKKILEKEIYYLLNKNPITILNKPISKIVGIKYIDEWLIGFDRRRRLVREGLSIALYDLVGKINNKPFYELLGSKKRNEVEGMPVIHVFDKEKRIQILKKWEELGYRNFKIKLTGVLKDDIKVLENLLLNKENESKIVIIDANYGYKNKDDICKLSFFAKENNINYLQDPIKLSIHSTAKLMSKCDYKFTADNTAWWPNSKRVIDENACAIVNHHPNIQGGLDWLMKTANYAKAKGIPNIIGSSGTFGIQNAAFQGMSAITGIGYPCEEIGLVPYYDYLKEYYSFSDRPNVLKEDYLLNNGKIVISSKPGLGIEVDEKKVKRFAVWSKEFYA